MQQPARGRPKKTQRISVVEYICILVVLLAAVATVAWIVTHSGGGVLNQG